MVQYPSSERGLLLLVDLDDDSVALNHDRILEENAAVPLAVTPPGVAAGVCVSPPLAPRLLQLRSSRVEVANKRNATHLDPPQWGWVLKQTTLAARGCW